jgi:hypothetical protein
MLAQTLTSQEYRVSASNMLPIKHETSGRRPDTTQRITEINIECLMYLYLNFN